MTKMLPRPILSLLISLIYITTCSSLRASQISRRNVLTRDFVPRAFLTGALVFSIANPSDALDMDSFANAQLSSSQESTTTKMSDDEALCKYGQPSKKTGDACVRAGLPTKRKTGVDAYGTVDRGDFTRCSFPYEMVDGKYVQQRICE